MIHSLVPATIAWTILTAIGMAQTTWYVDCTNGNCAGANGSAAQPFCTIQEGINAAIDGDTVLVLPCTYVENIDFLGKAITLRSRDGAAVTTIDGGNSATVVKFENGEQATSILDGFRIQNGRGSSGISGSAGGGISCLSFGPSVRPTIRNNTITGNRATAGGGIYGYSSRASIESNRIYGNTAGVGAGVFDRLGGVTLLGNTIRNNGSGNSGDGVYGYSSSTNIVNSTIISNARSGFRFIYSSPLVLNSTIANNFGPGISGKYGFSARVTSSIVWNNSGSEIYADGYTSMTVTHSDVQGGYVGTGNINADPLFIDPANGDFRLSCNSPCIEAGTNTPPAGTLPVVDVEGDARIVDGDSNGTATVDMGSDEFDLLWIFNGPATSGGTASFTAQAPPAQNGFKAFVFISLGEGSSTGGIVVPMSGSKKIALDLDSVFNLWAGLPIPLRQVSLTSCPGATTVPVSPLPTIPVGLSVYFAGFSIDVGGAVPSVTPTRSFVTQ